MDSFLLPVDAIRYSLTIDAIDTLLQKGKSMPSPADVT
jgi:hypothetical protein